jgi:plastocyanin domain-containing protein
VIIINTLGVTLIGIIIWWFWLYKPVDVSVRAGELVIQVENGAYQPAHLSVPANSAVTLRFIRKDKSPCSETVVFPELEISASLEVGAFTTVEIPALAPGEYTFHCQMQMYRGSITVKEKV